MRKIASFMLPTLLLFIFSPGSSRSLPQKRYSLRPIIAMSDLIVYGEVTNIETKWSDDKDRRMIWTYITVSVEEYVKGSSPSKDIVIRYPGGAIKEDDIIAVPTISIPSLNLNEKVIVMLELLPDHMHYVVVDSGNGKISIDEKGNVAGNKISRQEFIQMIKEIVASQKTKISGS